MYDSECVAVLHKYKHVAGNPLKFNIPVLTYLNEVDKHTANYACSGFGEWRKFPHYKDMIPSPN